MPAWHERSSAPGPAAALAPLVRVEVADRPGPRFKGPLLIFRRNDGADPAAPFSGWAHVRRGELLIARIPVAAITPALLGPPPAAAAADLHFPSLRSAPVP